MIGSIIWRKGVDILIKAINILPHAVVRECVFIFVGKLCNPDLEEKIIKIKTRYPEHIVFTGELPLEQVYQMYSGIDYLICASRDDPMPVVITNALSAGVPCICSENTGSAAIIQKYNAGFVFTCNSSRKLKKEIVRTFYLEMDEYDYLSHNARCAYEDEYSEDVFFRKVKAMLTINS